MQQIPRASSPASYQTVSGSKSTGYGGAAMTDATQYFVIVTLAADLGLIAYIALQFWRDRK